MYFVSQKQVISSFQNNLLFICSCYQGVLKAFNPVRVEQLKRLPSFVNLNVSCLISQCFMLDFSMFHAWFLNVSWMISQCFMHDFSMFHAWFLNVSWMISQCFMHDVSIVCSYSPSFICHPNMLLYSLIQLHVKPGEDLRKTIDVISVPGQMCLVH